MRKERIKYPKWSQKYVGENHMSQFHLMYKEKQSIVQSNQFQVSTVHHCYQSQLLTN
jgi:hypothetical protein